MTSFIIPLNFVELESDNYHVLIDVLLSDGTTTKWVVDTGASKSVFDGNLSDYFRTESTSDDDDEIQSAGINGDPLSTSIGIIPELNIAGMPLKNIKLAIINLDNINTLYEKYTDTRIAGLIGSDLLKEYNAVIDFGKMHMIFHREEV